MASYEQFALIYDRALNELPYDSWLNYIEDIFSHYHLSPKLVLDLGCGTGSMTNLMAKKGYEMLGVDLSEDMLAVARNKAKEMAVDVTYLNQDMTELDLYGTIDAVVSVGDALNYVVEEEDLLAAFKKVHLFLEPQGLFVFDMNTIYKFREVLGEKTYAENHEDYAYIWENYFYEEESMNEYEVTIFIKNDKGLFEKSTEIHHERGYTVEKIKELLLEAGFIIEGVYHETSFEKVKDTTERMYFVARENAK